MTVARANNIESFGSFSAYEAQIIVDGGVSYCQEGANAPPSPQK